MLLKSGGSVIATRRDELEMAQLEIQILRALGDHQVPVPRLLGNNHSHILIQEYISGTRLTQELKDADEQHCHRLLDSALEGLAAIHHAATAGDLESRVEALGYEDTWISGLIERPTVIGEFLGVPAPSLDESALINHLRMREPRFIKWDARPGNALVNDAGQVVWFDWEHAGKRNRLDDLAWILGDEYVPEFPEVEKRLLDEYVAKFAGPMSDRESWDYLMCYGTFHMVVRRGLILKYMTGKGWNLDNCIE
jgi:aminoglycoside phosphotransferase (APT) family kinase protein